MQAYEDATSSPWGYLLVDTSPGMKEMDRLRTDIFPGEAMAIYVPKSLKLLLKKNKPPRNNQKRIQSQPVTINQKGHQNHLEKLPQKLRQKALDKHLKKHSPNHQKKQLNQGKVSKNKNNTWIKY